MRYQIVHVGNSLDLVARVNELLEEGWELYGDPISSICQAMVKKESIRTKWMERFEVEHNPMTDAAYLYYKANNGKVYKIDPEKLARDIEAKESSNG